MIHLNSFSYTDYSAPTALPYSVFQKKNVLTAEKQVTTASGLGDW